MDEYTIRQAIDLIKAKRLTDARKLLRPVLEVSPENEAAWIWFSSTFTRVSEQLEVLQFASQFCPGSQPIIRGIQRLEFELADKRGRGEEVEPADVDRFLPVLSGRRQNPKQGYPSNPSISDGAFPQIGSEAEPPTSEASESNWIDSLRSATIAETSIQENPEGSSSEQINETPKTLLWEKEFHESEPVESKQSIPEPAITHEDDLLPSIPQARTVLWHGQDTVQESVDSPPFYMDMSVAPEEQFTYEQPKTTSVKKPVNPYQIPYFLAVSVGVILIIVIIIFLVVIGMVTLS